MIDLCKLTLTDWKRTYRAERASHEAIALLAYLYWEGEGRPDGQDQRHWRTAQVTLEIAADFAALDAWKIFRKLPGEQR